MPKISQIMQLKICQKIGRNIQMYAGMCKWKYAQKCWKMQSNYAQNMQIYAELYIYIYAQIFMYMHKN